MRPTCTPSDSPVPSGIANFLDPTVRHQVNNTPVDVLMGESKNAWDSEYSCEYNPKETTN
ncbi:hypothetical protein Hanom_Chr12g01125321 [Helianthus anomalus]